jgi:hypothetical protein
MKDSGVRGKPAGCQGQVYVVWPQKSSMFFWVKVGQLEMMK